MAACGPLIVPAACAEPVTIPAAAGTPTALAQAAMGGSISATQPA